MRTKSWFGASYRSARATNAAIARQRLLLLLYGPWNKSACVFIFIKLQVLQDLMILQITLVPFCRTERNFRPRYPHVVLSDKNVLSDLPYVFCACCRDLGVVVLLLNTFDAVRVMR